MPRRSRAAWFAATAVALLAIAAGAGYFFLRDRAPPLAPAVTAPTPIAPTYVGAAACAPCHAKEYEAWRGSHHDLAMQGAARRPCSALRNANFTYAGMTSTFFRRDGKFFVNTDGPDGKLADFEIRYTFGVTPLQQYLIEFPGGRLQALGDRLGHAAARTRAGSAGSTSIPSEKVDARRSAALDRLDQNWNYMCADCHSTNLRKNYDAAADRYDDDLVRDRRRLRGLPRAGLEPRRVGEAGGRLARLDASRQGARRAARRAPRRRRG